MTHPRIASELSYRADRSVELRQSRRQFISTALGALAIPAVLSHAQTPGTPAKKRKIKIVGDDSHTIVGGDLSITFSFRYVELFKITFEPNRTVTMTKTECEIAAAADQSLSYVVTERPTGKSPVVHPTRYILLNASAVVHTTQSVAALITIRYSVDSLDPNLLTLSFTKL